LLRPYGQVLAVTGARQLLLSALVARLPQGMATLAILLLVRGSTHSYAAAGLAVGVQELMTAALSPALGRAIDRLGRARVLMPCALAYAALLWGLVLAAELHAGTAVLVVLAGAGGGLLPPIAPTVRALLRATFSDVGVRERAYALESIVQEFIWIAGPLLVAVVITILSPAAATVLLGVVSITGTAYFLRGPLTRDGARPDERPRAGAALASRTLRLMLVPVCLFGAALGSTEVGLPALALHVGSRSTSGLLLAVWSVGSMLGGLAYGARSWQSPVSMRYGVLLVLGVVFTVPLVLARSVLAGVIGSLLAGLTIAPVFSCQYSLVGHAVAPGTETEAFTWVSAALVGGIAAGSAIAGALVSGAGESAPFVFSGAVLAGAALTGIAAGSAVRRPAAVTDNPSSACERVASL
jgi:MFS family permease